VWWEGDRDKEVKAWAHLSELHLCNVFKYAVRFIVTEFEIIISRDIYVLALVIESSSSRNSESSVWQRAT
jgi:hypothetical protein